MSKLPAGTIVATHKRKVTSVLRVMGSSQELNFQVCHGRLNRAVWFSLALLQLWARAFASEGPLIFEPDDTKARHCDAWYPKAQVTFFDTIACLRRALGSHVCVSCLAQ